LLPPRQSRLRDTTGDIMDITDPTAAAQGYIAIAIIVAALTCFLP
jgi:hypothetical protein